MSNDGLEPTLRTIEEEAELLRVSPRTLATLMARHKPPVLRVGRRILFDDIAHKTLIEALRAPTASKAPGERIQAPPSSAAQSAYDKVMKLGQEARKARRRKGTRTFNSGRP